MKFSIVTPSYNSEKYIAETIESVISQKGNFEIEYFVIDGGSTDKTVEIIKSYERMIKEESPILKCRRVIFKWITEKDQGMYDAINKGFNWCSGNIYAWINSDDIYLPGAFEIINTSFQSFREIKWLKGITSYINESSTIYETGKCFIYTQEWIQKGVYGRECHFIQQDSVFWRAELWEDVGIIEPDLKRAGDYFLWSRFSEKAKLYSVHAYLSCFRKTKGQLSQDMNEYRREMLRVSPSYGIRGKFIVYFFKFELLIPLLLRSLCYKLLFGKHIYSLVELEEGAKPVLKSGSYYDLKKKI
ncbi:MAG: glycosyltransferase [Nitrospinae bacterium]|nr:glycosyltransferase [Nitrospinota bacterium]